MISVMQLVGCIDKHYFCVESTRLPLCWNYCFITCWSVWRWNNRCSQAATLAQWLLPALYIKEMYTHMVWCSVDNRTISPMKHRCNVITRNSRCVFCMQASFWEYLKIPLCSICLSKSSLCTQTRSCCARYSEGGSFRGGGLNCYRFASWLNHCEWRFVNNIMP